MEDAMKTLLDINSSVSGTNSVSRVLVAHAVAEFASANPGARIVRRAKGTRKRLTSKSRIYGNYSASSA
jgi:hypothetical protein